MRDDDETGVETTELAGAHTLRIRQGANGDCPEGTTPPPPRPRHHDD